MLLCKNCVTIVTIYNNPLHFRDQNRKYIHFYSLPDLDLMMWPWQQNIKVLSAWAHRYLSIAAVHVPLWSLVRKIAGVPLLVPPPCSGSRVANYPSGCRVSLRCVLYAYVTLWQSERLMHLWSPTRPRRSLWSDWPRPDPPRPAGRQWLCDPTGTLGSRCSRRQRARDTGPTRLTHTRKPL